MHFFNIQKMNAILDGLLSAFGFCIGVGCLIGFCKWLWDGFSCSKRSYDEFIARQQNRDSTPRTGNAPGMWDRYTQGDLGRPPWPQN